METTCNTTDSNSTNICPRATSAGIIIGSTEKKKRDKGCFKFKPFTIRHDLCGMKVGTDAVLLTGYASLEEDKPNNEVWEGMTDFLESEHLSDSGHYDANATVPRRILEIGCGSGVITLLLTHRYKNAIVDSIDIDEGAIKQALFNIEHCPIPTVQQRVRLFHCPAQEFTSPPLNPKLQTPPTNTDDTNATEIQDKQKNLNTHFKYDPAFDSTDASDGIYDLIICAPPYFKSDETTDMIVRMQNKRRIARHTHTLLMEELADVVYTMLKKDTGRFKTIFSLPYPADVFQKAALSKGLQCIEKVHVHDNSKDEPVRLMETYKATSLPPQNNTTTTTTQSASDTTNDEPMKDQPAEPTRTETNEGAPPTNDSSPLPVERHFSIYTASYKEMPLMHRPYTNQYKFLVRDFCVHFLNK